MQNPTITPKEAVQDYLDKRKVEQRKSTWRNDRYPLRYLLDWLDENDVTHINDLNPYTINKFLRARQQDGIAIQTYKNNVTVIRGFMKFCANNGLVDGELVEAVEIPVVENGEDVDDTSIDPDLVESILDYLYKFEYAERKHCTFQLIWHTCIRMGTVHALDVGDFSARKQELYIRHRPDTDTPLKNGYAAERTVNLGKKTTDLLEDYVSLKRYDVEDEYGRRPLFTTRYGRLSANQLRRNMYALTRPCVSTGECPHGRKIDECEASYKRAASKCPTSISPHPLRRSAITQHLKDDWPVEELSKRANVSTKILEKHYNVMTEREEAARRKKYVKDV